MYKERIFEFTINGKTVGPNLYGIMIAVGILCAMGVLFYYGKKIKISEKFLDFMFYDAIAAIALSFVSAALFQALYNYLEDPTTSYIEHLQGGGMTFIGGLIGGTVIFLGVYFILRKRLDGRLIDTVSMLPCVILVAHAFGRVGCFFGGCCYGKPTDSFLGVNFPGIGKMHPTQLYEAAFLFILFAVCSYLLLKKKFRHNMSLYLVAYGIFRFLIEFLRYDQRGQIIPGVPISPSQFWSIFMVVFGVALFFIMEKLFPVKKESATAGVEGEVSGAAVTGNEAEADTDPNSERKNTKE